MRFSFLAFCLVLILASCSNEKPVPDNILNRATMTSILIDIHLIEAKIKALNVEPDSAKTLYRAFEKQILEEHQVSESLYQESYNWHFNNISSMNSIYDAVVDSLNVRLQTQSLRK